VTVGLLSCVTALLVKRITLKLAVLTVSARGSRFDASERNEIGVEEFLPAVHHDFCLEFYAHKWYPSWKVPRFDRSENQYTDQSIHLTFIEDKATRDKAIKGLAAFLSEPANARMSEKDMAKLWKGIFYCALTCCTMTYASNVMR
jgi:hypothetical protein